MALPVHLHPPQQHLGFHPMEAAPHMLESTAVKVSYTNQSDLKALSSLPSCFRLTPPTMLISARSTGPNPRSWANVLNTISRRRCNAADRIESHLIISGTKPKSRGRGGHTPSPAVMASIAMNCGWSIYWRSGDFH